MVKEKHATIWVCYDCAAVQANGETEGTPDREPFNLIGEGEHVTSGMMADEHHEDCDFRNSSAAVETDELFGVPEGEQASYVFDCNLDCENEEFSWSHCGGCGTTLAGSRHAVTVWWNA